MNENLLGLLKIENKEIQSAARILRITYNKCQKIGIKKKYNDNELLHFEGLTARFSRLSEIIIQKILRTIINIELDRYDSTRDLLNLSEKKNIIHDSHNLAKTRTIRNKIVHEYMLENFQDIFKDALILTPVLLEDAKLISRFCKEKYKI